MGGRMPLPEASRDIPERSKCTSPSHRYSPLSGTPNTPSIQRSTFSGKRGAYDICAGSTIANPLTGDTTSLFPQLIAACQFGRMD
jgi:hypothetical protein